MLARPPTDPLQPSTYPLQILYSSPTDSLHTVSLLQTFWKPCRKHYRPFSTPSTTSTPSTAPLGCPWRGQVSSSGGSGASETPCESLQPSTSPLPILYNSHTDSLHTVASYRPSRSLPRSITDPLQALYNLYTLYSTIGLAGAQASEQQRRQRC